MLVFLGRISLIITKSHKTVAQDFNQNDVESSVLATVLPCHEVMKTECVNTLTIPECLFSLYYHAIGVYNVN